MVAAADQASCPCLVAASCLVQQGAGHAGQALLAGPANWLVAAVGRRAVVVLPGLLLLLLAAASSQGLCCCCACVPQLLLWQRGAWRAVQASPRPQLQLALPLLAACCCVCLLAQQQVDALRLGGVQQQRGPADGVAGGELGAHAAELSRRVAVSRCPQIQVVGDVHAGLTRGQADAALDHLLLLLLLQVCAGGWAQIQEEVAYGLQAACLVIGRKKSCLLSFPSQLQPSCCSVVWDQVVLELHRYS